MTRHVVAAVGEVAPGQNKVVTVKGREICLFNLKGEYFALLNRCPHEGAALNCGKLVGIAVSDEPGRYRLERQGEMIRCPWHGWQYDIRTGQSWCDPTAMRIKSYLVTLEPGKSIAAGPYVAESFSVAIDQDYIVIDL